MQKAEKTLLILSNGSCKLFLIEVAYKTLSLNKVGFPISVTHSSSNFSSY